MTEREQQVVLSWYQPLFRANGDCAAGVGWNQTNQQRRFAVLTSGFDLTSQPVEVLDVGCGLAHLYDWLVLQNAQVRYRGIDVVPEYVQTANRRFGATICQVLDAETEDLPPCDYAVASGCFNVDLGDYGMRNEVLLKTVVTRMAQATRKGFAFDCLVQSHPTHIPGQAYFSHNWLLDFCDSFAGMNLISAPIPAGNYIVQLTHAEVAHARG